MYAVYNTLAWLINGLECLTSLWIWYVMAIITVVFCHNCLKISFNLKSIINWQASIHFNVHTAQSLVLFHSVNSNHCKSSRNQEKQKKAMKYTGAWSILCAKHWLLAKNDYPPYKKTREINGCSPLPAKRWNFIWK